MRDIAQYAQFQDILDRRTAREAKIYRPSAIFASVAGLELQIWYLGECVNVTQSPYSNRQTIPRLGVMTQHILIPTDFSEPSEHATMTAVDLAIALGAKITLVHVHDSPRFGVAEVPAILGASEEALLELAQVDMLRLVERVHAKDIEVDFVIRKGHPASTVLEVAREVGADLIVVGTHGRRALDRVLMGSVAERVVRTSHLPVLVVPPAPVQSHR